MPSPYIPETLKELTNCFDNEDGWHPALRCLLDDFYVAPLSVKQNMIAEEPALMPDDFFNAYVAAVAEHLAWDYRLEVPAWCCKKERFLRLPVFTDGLETAKMHLVMVSPSAFRRRMIFTGGDPLCRPLKYGKTLMEDDTAPPGRFPTHSTLPVPRPCA